MKSYTSPKRSQRDESALIMLPLYIPFPKLLTDTVEGPSLFPIVVEQFDNISGFGMPYYTSTV